jgi:hypothetical protein
MHNFNSFYTQRFDLILAYKIVALGSPFTDIIQNVCITNPWRSQSILSNGIFSDNLLAFQESSFRVHVLEINPPETKVSKGHLFLSKNHMESLFFSLIQGDHPTEAI